MLQDIHCSCLSYTAVPITHRNKDFVVHLFGQISCSRCWNFFFQICCLVYIITDNTQKKRFWCASINFVTHLFGCFKRSFVLGAKFLFFFIYFCLVYTLIKIMQAKVSTKCLFLLQCHLIYISRIFLKQGYNFDGQSSQLLHITDDYENPLCLFDKWLKEAENNDNLDWVKVMNVATVHEYVSIKYTVNEVTNL